MLVEKINLNNDVKFVFVGGAPRSGTTLVQDILDSHPEIIGGPEFDRLIGIVDLRNKLNTSIENKRINSYCSKKKVDNEVYNLIKNLLSNNEKRKKFKIISEKTPSNVLIFKDILEIIPDSKCIFVVRDPRGIISSLLEVGKRAKKYGLWTPITRRKTYRAIKMTEKYLKAGLNVLKTNKDSIFLLRYEELLKKPKDVTMKMCKFLSIEWSSDMIRPGEKNHLRSDSKGGKVWSTNASGKNIDKSRINNWKDKLNLIQIVFISKHFKNLLKLSKAGYNMNVKHIPLFYRVIGVFWFNLSIYFHKIIDWFRNFIKRILFSF